MRRLATLASAILVLVVVGGCRNDCRKLVDKTCGAIGASSTDCQQARDLASRSSSDDQEKCRAILSVISAFGK